MTRERILLVRGIALAADAMQIALFPLFGGGAIEGADAILDVVVGLLLCSLCGFQLAFLPTFVGEALPVIDMFPSWTLAALYVTRGKAQPELPKP